MHHLDRKQKTSLGGGFKAVSKASSFDRRIEVGVPWNGKARWDLVAEPGSRPWPCSLCPCTFLSDTPLQRDPGPEQHQEEERESADAPGQTLHPGCV